MIPVQREPDGMGPPYECCALCGDFTAHWHAPGGAVRGDSVAVCPTCAEKREESELPTKQEWFKHPVRSGAGTVSP